MLSASSTLRWEVVMAPDTWATQLAAALAESSPRQVGVVPLIYPLMEALQLRATINRLCWTKADIDIGRLVEVLVLNRLSAPQPLYRVGAWVDQTVVVPMFGLAAAQLYDQRFGRALDDLHSVLAEAWAQLAARAVQQEGVDLSVLHWDTTSVYLEGAYAESAFAEYGHSSDGHADNKQVKLGLDVTSRERMPLLYDLLPGATADVSTPVPNLQAIGAFLERPECAGLAVRPLVVGDGKMLTPAAVAAAHRLHLSYLGPWEANTSVNAVIRSVSDDELAAHPLDYRPQRQAPADEPFVPYRGVWQPFAVSYDGQTYADRALIVWSAGKQRLDAEKRKVQLKRLLNRLAAIQSHLNQGRYISREYAAHQIALAQRSNPAKGLVHVALSGQDRQLVLAFHIDRQALAQAQALDGKYLLGTNAADLTASQALTCFKAQDGVEKSHASLKGPLRVHPLYLHADQRIAGLMFISVLALLLCAILELRCRRAGLQYTAERVLQAFSGLYATDLTFIDGSHYAQLGRLTTFQQRVVAGLQFPAPARYLEPLPG
jgi:transposase